MIKLSRQLRVWARRLLILAAAAGVLLSIAVWVLTQFRSAGVSLVYQRSTDRFRTDDSLHASAGAGTLLFSLCRNRFDLDARVDPGDVSSETWREALAEPEGIFGRPRGWNARTSWGRSESYQQSVPYIIYHLEQMTEAERQAAYRAGKEVTLVLSRNAPLSLRMGFSADWEKTGLSHLGHLLVPCWLPVLLSSALLAWLTLPGWLQRRRARLRIVRQKCPACGYDLRGLTGARCPECGTMAEAPTTNPEPRTTNP